MTSVRRTAYGRYHIQTADLPLYRTASGCFHIQPAERPLYAGLHTVVIIFKLLSFSTGKELYKYKCFHFNPLYVYNVRMLYIICIY